MKISGYNDDEELKLNPLSTTTRRLHVSAAVFCIYSRGYAILHPQPEGRPEVSLYVCPLRLRFLFSTPRPWRAPSLYRLCIALPVASLSCGFHRPRLSLRPASLSLRSARRTSVLAQALGRPGLSTPMPGLCPIGDSARRFVVKNAEFTGVLWVFVEFI